MKQTKSKKAVKKVKRVLLTKEQKSTKDKARVQRWRKANRAEFNAYQRGYNAGVRDRKAKANAG